MSFNTRRVLIITPFYMLFQFFLLKYIFLLVMDVDDIYFVVVSILIGLMHCLPMFFEAKKSTVPARFISLVDGVWMWASLMFLIDIVIIYLIKMFIPIPYGLICVLLLIVPILGIYNYYKANNLVIKEKTVELTNLGNDINIVHLSDVHFGSVHHKSTIQNIVSELKELENSCELVIISGDLADGSCAVHEDDFLAFQEVNMPIIFTPGNHDFYLEIDDVIKACKKAGIIVLDNESMEFGCLNIFGAPFSFDNQDMPKLDKSLIKEGFVNILNYHVPFYWDEFSSLGFDIQLSGHTHGGQFYPAVNFANLIFEYNIGLFKNDLGKYIHVSTGIGSMGVPMRWGTDSEIVVLKLKRA